MTATQDSQVFASTFGDYFVGVSQIHADRGLPDMSIFELAVISAITHMGARSDDDIAARVADWFVSPVRVPDVRMAAQRMVSKGWLEAGSDNVADGRLTEEGLDITATLYGGTIRMLDRGMGLLNTRILMNVFGNLLSPEKDS